jgi:hypothetical protein
MPPLLHSFSNERKGEFGVEYRNCLLCKKFAISKNLDWVCFFFLVLFFLLRIPCELIHFNSSRKIIASRRRCRILNFFFLLLWYFMAEISVFSFSPHNSRKRKRATYRPRPRKVNLLLSLCFPSGFLSLSIIMLLNVRKRDPVSTFKLYFPSKYCKYS